MRLLVILFLAISLTAHTQKAVSGVFGKKNIFTVSATSSITWINFMKKTREPGVYKFGPRVFELGLYIAYDRVLSRKSVLGVSYTMDPCVITTHSLSLQESDYANEYVLGDHLFINHEAMLNYKLYTKENIAGLGFYLKFGLGMSIVHRAKQELELSNLSFTTGTSNYSANYNEKGKHAYYVTNTTPKDYKSNFSTSAGLFEFALGWDIPIYRWWAFNFEMGTTIAVGYSRYNGGVGFGYSSGTYFHRDFGTYSDPYSNVELERRIRNDQGRKNLYNFKLGFKFYI